MPNLFVHRNFSFLTVFGYEQMNDALVEVNVSPLKAEHFPSSHPRKNSHDYKRFDYSFGALDETNNFFLFQKSELVILLFEKIGRTSLLLILERLLILIGLYPQLQNRVYRFQFSGPYIQPVKVGVVLSVPICVFIVQIQAPARRDLRHGL